MKRSVRSATVVIAICSWFAISNHCAFAALATKTDSVPTGCPFHSKPKEKQSSNTQCCKILRAVASVSTKGWGRDDSKLCGADAYCREPTLTVSYSQTTLLPLCFDTGPPGVCSFAELILQRSLLAHAPPIAA
jgi:hypothetical protein